MTTWLERFSVLLRRQFQRNYRSVLRLVSRHVNMVMYPNRSYSNLLLAHHEEE